MTEFRGLGLGTGNCTADEEQRGLFQPSLCNIFIATEPRADAQRFAGSPGASPELPQCRALALAMGMVVTPALWW